jgi:hypothetical protein
MYGEGGLDGGGVMGGMVLGGGAMGGMGGREGNDEIGDSLMPDGLRQGGSARVEEKPIPRFDFDIQLVWSPAKYAELRAKKEAEAEAEAAKAAEARKRAADEAQAAADKAAAAAKQPGKDNASDAKPGAGADAKK